MYSYIHNAILNRNQKGTEAEMTDYIYQEKMHKNPAKKTTQMIQHKPYTDDLQIKHHLPISPVFSRTACLDTVQLCGRDSRGRDKRARDKKAARRHQEEPTSSRLGLKTKKKSRNINFTNENNNIVAEVLRSPDDLTTLMEKYDRKRFEGKKYIVRYPEIWDQIYTELFEQTKGELFLSQMQIFCDHVQALIEEKSKALLFMLDEESQDIQKVIGNGIELYEWLENCSPLNIILKRALQIKPQILDNIFKYLMEKTGGTFYASLSPKIIHIITALLQKVQASLGIITILDPNGNISRVIAEPIDLYYLLADFPPPSLSEKSLFFAHPDFLNDILNQLISVTKGVIASSRLQDALNAVYAMIQDKQREYDLYDSSTSILQPEDVLGIYGSAWTSTADASRVTYSIHPRRVRPVPADIMEKYTHLNERDFVGYHFTTYENAISLLKSAPREERIGTGNKTGKGPGFYVTKNSKDSLWGPVALRIYVRDYSSLIKRQVKSEQATNGTQTILLFGRDEIVIPIKFFDRISVFLQEEWKMCSGI